MTPPVPRTPLELTAVGLLGLLLLAGAARLRRSRRDQAARPQERPQQPATTAPLARQPFPQDALFDDIRTPRFDMDTLRPGHAALMNTLLGTTPPEPGHFNVIDLKCDYHIFQEVYGQHPLTLTPGTLSPARFRVFDEQDPDAVLQTVKVLLGETYVLNPFDEAMVLAAASRVQRQGQANFRRFAERLEQDQATLNRLLTEYRSVYQPFREGSLLHALLPTLFPDGLPDGFTLQSAEVRRDGEDLANVSPWLLLQEGEHDLAVQALLNELNWTPDLAPQARVILEHHR